jgi:hypothetical protein
MEQTDKIQTQQAQAPRVDLSMMGLQPTTFDQLWAASQALAKSDVVPVAYRGKPHNVALGEMHVIDGKVGMSADLLVARVRASGKCSYFKLLQVTDEIAKYEGKRSDTGEVQAMDYTLAEAQAAGLLGKQNWKGNRRAMLMARASARLARELWPDVCVGLYVRDELDEIRSQTPDAAVQATSRPTTIDAVKAQARERLGIAQAASAPQATSEPRQAEIVQGAQAQAFPPPPDDHEDAEAFFGDAPRNEEPDGSNAGDLPDQEPRTPAHPLVSPANWYAPDMGGVDVNDGSELELRLPARIDNFGALMHENVWSSGPLKAWTPAQALQGGEGGGRHTLLRKAVDFAVSKRFEPHLIPRGALVADWCLALLERRYALMRAAGLATSDEA